MHPRTGMNISADAVTWTHPGNFNPLNLKSLMSFEFDRQIGEVRETLHGIAGLICLVPKYKPTLQ